MKVVKAASNNRSLGKKTTLVSNLSIVNTVVATILIKKNSKKYVFYQICGVCWRLQRY